jgi:hypothetical protein
MRNQRGILSFQIVLMVAALVAATVAPASARHDEYVTDLWLAVYDEQGNELDVISLDGAVILPRREPRVLQMFTEIDGNRHHVSTQFNVARGSGTWLNHYRNRQEQGQVNIGLHPNVEPRGPLYLEYEILDNVGLEDEGLRRGTIRVEVSDKVDQGSSIGHDRADTNDIVTAIYRGILLRDPDPAGAATAEQAIRDNGWDAIVSVARTTAISRESQVDVYQRGISNQQRLVALYGELLDMDASDVDAYVWREQLDRLGRGDISGVVLEMVQSEAFQDHFGIADTVWRRR